MYLKPFVFDDFVVQLNIFIDTQDQTCFVNSQTYQLMPLQLKKKKKKICFQISGANAWEVVVARSCVLFRSSSFSSLTSPGYVTGALIPTEKSY